ncbi:MAG: peptidase M48, partial [Luminiphilus sp.]|nr:peptidase M48 [Luminiphilus sp.]
VTAQSADGSASVAITLSRLDTTVTPTDYLAGTAAGDLSDQRELEQFGLSGSTARATAGASSKRLAVLDHKYRFLFEGTGADADALTIIESFRPLVAKEKARGPSRTLHYVQVPRGATVQSLSSGARIPDAEDQLRLINGYYPVGEPRIGDWIKTIR